MGGTRNPFFKEKVIFEFLQEQAKAVPFIEIHKAMEKAYGFTTGATQAAVERCLKEGAFFPIIEKKIHSVDLNRDIRWLAVNSDDLPSSPSSEDLLELHDKVSTGEVVIQDSVGILPLYLPRDQVDILFQLVDLLPDYNSIGELFAGAVMHFLREQIPPKTLKEAMHRAKTQGKDMNNARP